jgi:methylated-DNA-[protein]-cysteine S-methyltransferase
MAPGRLPAEHPGAASERQLQALYIATFRTPLGLFSFAVNGEGALAATALGDDGALRTRLRGRFASLERRGKAAHTATVQRQIEEYFAGTRRSFDLHLALEGSPFQHRVWTALQQIPYGETRSYAQLARSLGTSARAVGRANATNPVCLVVPCHRVIGADGSLTGFAFGEDIKRRLLEHEETVMSRSGNV